MLIAIGFVVVLGSVVLGYLLHGGHLLVLNQPSEFLIIGGAGLGSLLISTPVAVLRHMVSQLTAILRSPAAHDDYLDLLTMLYRVFRLMQQAGVMALESHADAPAESSVFSQHPGFLARPPAVEFLADSLKVMIMGGISPHDLETLMDQDLDVHHHEAMKPSSTLARIGDALPGLGIVAAVLGVVVTMGAIDGPANEIGHKIAAALVGTFLGVFLAYGFVQPLATLLEHRAGDDAHYLTCVKAGLLAIYKGVPPAIAVEFARRILPEDVRPSFDETEEAFRSHRSDQAAA